MTRALPARHRLIGHALRQYREGLGYRLGDAAKVLECHPSKISRIETGERGIRPKELRELLTEYGANPATREALLTLAGPCGRDGWWAAFGAVLGAEFRDFIAAENAATAIWTYAPLQVPALLQTPDYARAVAAADAYVPEDAEDLAVTATLTRQQIALRERGAILTAVIGEAALRQQVGGQAVLSAQLRHLADLADGRRPQIVIRVLPFTVGAHAAVGCGEFSVLQFGQVSASSLVHLAGPAGGTCPEDPDAASAYLKAFGLLRVFSLDPRQSATKITRLAGT